MTGGNARRKRARARHQAGENVPMWMCPYCRAPIGYVGRALSWFFGTQFHGCAPKSPTGNANLDALIAATKARNDAMSPEERAEHDQAQRESWARAMAPCEHGVADWETCPKCRAGVR